MADDRWSDEELTVALDFYFKVDASRTKQNHPAARKLATLLNGLPLTRRRGIRRTNASAHLRFANYLRLLEGNRAFTSFGGGDRHSLGPRDFALACENREELVGEAEVGEGALTNSEISV